MKSKLPTFFKQTTKKKNLLAVTIVCLALVSASLLGAAISKVTNNNVATSEIQFSSRSDNTNLLGSVVPASCQSYASFGVAHTAGDTAGHCSDSCPADGMPVPISMKACIYTVTTGFDIQESNSYFYITNSSASCPSTHPNYGGSYTSEMAWGNTTICAPRPVPTVDVNFQ